MAPRYNIIGEPVSIVDGEILELVTEGDEEALEVNLQSLHSTEDNILHLTLSGLKLKDKDNLNEKYNIVVRDMVAPKMMGCARALVADWQRKRVNISYHETYERLKVEYGVVDHTE